MMLERGEIVHNLQVVAIRRSAHTLTYVCRCLRENCQGEVHMPHERLINMGAAWCPHPGCNSDAAARANRPTIRYELPTEAIRSEPTEVSRWRGIFS
jgi:hypothetical protein